MPTRRGLLGTSLAAFVTYAALGTLQPARARVPAAVAAALRRHEALAQALAAGELAPQAWQHGVEALSASLDAQALAAAIRDAESTPVDRPMRSDPRKFLLRFRGEDGEPLHRHYGVALFRFDPANVITPHGHRHMVSAHFVVEGRLRVRNYDRLEDLPGAMRLRPTRDAIVGPGEVSTMSSARDNVHWFVPVGGRAATFDVVVSDLDPGAKSYEIQAVDPLRARARADGTLEAPIISFAESSRRYTAAV